MDTASGAAAAGSSRATAPLAGAARRAALAYATAQMNISARQLATGLCALALPFGMAACGETASTSSFKGESHKVAETVSNLQTDATDLSEQKVCDNDLAATLTTRLGWLQRLSGKPQEATARDRRAQPDDQVDNGQRHEGKRARAEHLLRQEPHQHAPARQGRLTLEGLWRQTSRVCSAGGE